MKSILFFTLALLFIAYIILNNNIYHLICPASTILEDKNPSYFIVKNTNYQETENKKILFFIPGDFVDKKENLLNIETLNIKEDIEKTVVFVYPEKADNIQEIILNFEQIIKQHIDDGWKTENMILLGYCFGGAIAAQIIHDGKDYQFGMFIDYKPYSSIEKLIEVTHGIFLKEIFNLLFKYKWEIDTSKIFDNLSVKEKYVVTTTDSWGTVPFAASLYYNLKKTFPGKALEKDGDTTFYNIRELHSKFNKNSIVISKDYIEDPKINFIENY